MCVCVCVCVCVFLPKFRTGVVNFLPSHSSFKPPQQHWVDPPQALVLLEKGVPRVDARKLLELEDFDSENSPCLRDPPIDPFTTTRTHLFQFSLAPPFWRL